MSTNKAVVWNLDTTDEEVTNESISAVSDIHLTGESETALPFDNRKLVKAHHYATGGKYRSVLKIHVKYDAIDKNWTAGTVWLLKDDLVVTAGHVVLDRLRRRAVSLNTYAGYHGLSSMGTNDVQKRRGKGVVILEAYYSSRNRTYDVALVKLEEPFENAQPFTHCDTPEQGESSLGVVGYPGDRGRNGNDRDLGPFMYKEFAQTSWDLRTSDSHLLQYPISTYGGQSGAPVIRPAKSHRIIGTHVRGSIEGATPQFNSASPIGGRYGSPYNALARVIEEELESISGDKQMHRFTLGNPKKEQVYPVLKRYRTLFLVDDSESMMDDDVELGTKWETVKSIIGKIASIAFENTSNGIEVQFFNFVPEEADQRAKLKNLKSVREVTSLFEERRPEGPSLTADRLDDVLSQYCCEFEKDRDTKGLNLIVVTDGDPSDGQDVEGIIVKYAKELKRLWVPLSKVGIQFVQVGKDPKATLFLRRLDDNLKEKYKLDRDVSEKRKVSCLKSGQIGGSFSVLQSPRKKSQHNN